MALRHEQARDLLAILVAGDQSMDREAPGRKRRWCRKQDVPGESW